MWSVDATADGATGADSLWLAGAVFVFVDTFAGAVAVASAAAVLRRLKR